MEVVDLPIPPLRRQTLTARHDGDIRTIEILGVVEIIMVTPAL
jgi:hypothetical protein